MTRAPLTGILILATTALATPPAARAPVAEDPVATRLRLARAADAAGDADRARDFRLAALSLSPRSTEIMGEIARFDGGDPETSALWVHVAATRWSGERFALAGDWPEVGHDDLAMARKIVQRRAQTLKAVLAALRRPSGPGGGILVRHLANVGRALRPAGPGEHAALETAVDAGRDRCRPDPDRVVRELRDLARAALGEGRDDVALAAARILVGLNQQKDREPASRAAPDARFAREVIAKVRARMRAAEKEIHTVETLSVMSRDEATRFSDDHATWDRPGVALSPAKLYRLETVCGQRTLLIAADEIEHQHHRVARWFGADPFAERRGTVRLCRSRPDFERAGAPFWWAGGFQSGDLTGVIVNFTDGKSVARTLTHELTHRFDGALHPGLPSWLLEGRAVYAEVCTPHPRASALDERLLSGGRIASTHQQRYGREDKLESLIRGSVPDYRDNYSAGYALFLFLSRFEGFDPPEENAPRIFRAHIGDYLKSFAARRRQDPVERFVAAFADGKNRRPDGFEEFAATYERFLLEACQEEPPDWRVRWTLEHQRARREARRAPARPILDARTWPRDRRRFDAPEYGEGQAGPAGVLLAANGRPAVAREALAWALEVDEPVAAWLALAAELHEEAGQAAVAWAYRMAAARTDPARHERPRRTPGGPIGAAHRAVAALAGLHADLERTAREANRARLARVHRADHDRLADILGSPPLPAEAAETRSGAPDCLPYRTVLEGGMIGDRWSPSRCGPGGPWHSPGPGRLVLGRSEPGPERSGRIRDAGFRRVFVRDREFHEGTYSLRCRIRLLTSVFDAFLVLGRTRHDRGMTVRLSGGDRIFQLGGRQEAAPLDRVQAVVSDLRPFDSASSRLYEVAVVEPARDEFEVEVHVSGPRIRVLVDGCPILTHRRTTGDPVEGTIGFGLTQGIVVVEDPVVRHHRALGDGRICPCDRHDEAVRFDRPIAFALGSCVGRRVIGLPESPGGTLLLWYANRSALGDDAAALLRRAVEQARTRFELLDLPIEVTVAVPPGVKLPVATEVGVAEGRLVIHRGHSGPIWGGGPAWLLVDDRGVVRCGGPGFLTEPAFSLVHRLVGW